MYSHFSIVLVISAIIINSIVFGYVASNARNNKINHAYLIYLTFIILYTILDCIIIQVFNDIESKNIIVKMQTLFWMPLAILFLNFIYLLLNKQKDNIYYLFTTGTIVSMFFTLSSDKVLSGLKTVHFGTIAETGPWFIPVIFIGIIPTGIYAIYLIAKEGKIFDYFKKHKQKRSLLSQQLKILFFGSIICFLSAVSNVFIDDFFGYSIGLSSLSISLQSIILFPALIKYNFLNKPISKLGDELYANSSDAVLITNQNGIILNLNKAARKIFQLKGRVIDRNIQEFFLSDYNFYSSNDNFETKTVSGDYVTITQTNILEGKQSAGKILVIRDISARKSAEQQLVKSEESYKNLIKSSGDIIYNIDVNGKFTYVNPIFEQVSGYNKKEILGKNSIMMVQNHHKKKVRKNFKELIKTNNKKLERSIQIEVQGITKDGKTLWMENGMSTLVSNNVIKGISIISRDITDRKKAEAKLLNTTQELTTAQEVAGIGSFTYDFKKDLIIWSDKLYQLYGQDKKTFNPTREKFFNEVVHPESREMAINITENAIKNKMTEIDYVHKTVLKDDDEKWMHAIIKLVYNNKNEAIFMNGTSQDITELYTTRVDLEKSELRLKSAQKIAKLGTWEENHNTGELYWSPILRNMLNMKTKAKINQNIFWDIVHPEDVKWMKINWEKAEKEKIPYSGTFRIKLKNGQVRHLNEHAEFLQDSKGRLQKTIGTVIDLTELHQYQEELRQLSSHIQEVQEEERGHIAREIHDELGQRLTGITMDIAYLQSKIGNDTSKEIKDRLAALAIQAESTIQIIRKISQELRPSILDDLGLISAIDWLQEQYNKRTNINFTQDMPKEEIKINGEYATALFRITQESLTNIIRHANAKNVNINIKLTNSKILLQIQDDGQGIDNIKPDNPKKSYGIFGMKERASLLGGKLQILNNSNRGTTVNLTLPYNPIEGSTT